MAQITIKKNNVDVTDKIFTPADFVDGAWHSDSIILNNASVFSVDVEYEEPNPDGADAAVDYRLQASIQELADNGKWYDMVKQANPSFSSENAPVRRLVATENFTNKEEGIEYIIPDELNRPAVGVTTSEAVLPAQARVCLSLGDRNSGGAGLTSIKISITGNIK